MTGEAQASQGRTKWWWWLPIGAFAVYGFWSGDPWLGAGFTFVLAIGSMTTVRPLRSWLRRPWFASAMNWFAPVAVASFCANRILSKDYWGAALFTVIWGFAMVNAIYLEPSPRRTLLYRLLRGALVLVSMAAIYAYATTGR